MEMTREMLRLVSELEEMKGEVMAVVAMWREPGAEGLSVKASWREGARVYEVVGMLERAKTEVVLQTMAAGAKSSEDVPA